MSRKPDISKVFVAQHDAITLGPDIFTRGFIDDPPPQLVKMALTKETITNPVTGGRERRVLLVDEVDEDVLNAAMSGPTKTRMSKPPIGGLPESAEAPEQSGDILEDNSVLDGDQLL